jgi:predicted metal-dependent HD superfamily phosphohydrolase
MLSLPFALPEALEDALLTAYATPPRAYHHFGHVLEVLAHYRSVPDWDDPVSVALAVLFHDAVYVAGQSDNEQASAELAERCLAAHPVAEACSPARVRQLIMLTARHGGLDPAELDRDAARFLDCDMAILGAEPQRFAAYERAIAEEYVQLPAAAYRAGRARFLNKLLSSPRIYLSDTFRDRYERLARENLTRALAAL